MTNRVGCEIEMKPSVEATTTSIFILTKMWKILSQYMILLFLYMQTWINTQMLKLSYSDQSSLTTQSCINLKLKPIFSKK